jgi:hypothetical protein
MDPFLYIHIHTCTFICIHTYIHIYIYMDIYIYIYIYMDPFICMYIWTHFFSAFVFLRRRTGSLCSIIEYTINSLLRLLLLLLLRLFCSFICCYTRRIFPVNSCYTCNMVCVCVCVCHPPTHPASLPPYRHHIKRNCRGSRSTVSAFFLKCRACPRPVCASGEC